MTFFSPDEIALSVEISAEVIRCAGSNAVTYVPRPFDPSTFGRISRADLEIVRHVCNAWADRKSIATMSAEEHEQHLRVAAVWYEICQPQVLLCLVKTLEAAWLTSQPVLEPSATQKIAQSVADLMAHTEVREIRDLLLCIAECIAAHGDASGAKSTVKMF